MQHLSVEHIQKWSYGDFEDLRDVQKDSVNIYKQLQAGPGTKELTYVEHIVRRLQLCALYLRRQEYVLTHEIAKRGAFADAIQPFSGDETSKVRRNVRQWSAVGASLLGLAHKLGGYGVLLVLPESVPRSVWEWHLRRSSPRYEEAVTSLRDKGICDVATSTKAYQAGMCIAEWIGWEEAVADAGQVSDEDEEESLGSPRSHSQ